MGEIVALDGDCRAYVSAPDKGAGLGLVVLQEHWGLVPHIEDLCDRFAAEGFTALAPDLLPEATASEATASEPDEADSLMMALNLEQAARQTGAAVDLLEASPAVRGDGVGVVGFGMGGGLALMLAIQRPDDVRACVPFYGLVPGQWVQPDWSQLKAPVQGHFGEKDEVSTPERVRELEATLSGLAKEVEFFSYPDAGRGFFDDTRPQSYDPSAARTAWTRSLEFLRAKLG